MRLETIKENVLALVVALLLAFVVVFVINNTDFLKADIMSAPNNTNNINSDVSYSAQDWFLSLKSQKDFEGVMTISFYISYNPEQITVNKDLIYSDFDYALWNAGEWRINVILSNIWAIKVDDELLSVKTDEDETNINISDVVVSFTDWTTENLSINTR